MALKPFILTTLVYCLLLKVSEEKSDLQSDLLYDLNEKLRLKIITPKNSSIYSNVKDGLNEGKPVLFFKLFC